MEVIRFEQTGRVQIEIRLAANHSITMSQEAALKLAQDILDTLQDPPANPGHHREDAQNQVFNGDIETNTLIRSTRSALHLVGAYEIKPSRASIINAIHYHGYDFLLTRRGNYSGKVRRSDIKGLALIEVQASGPFYPGDLDLISMGDQAPYLAYFLDADGIATLTKDQAQETANPRVCFFLHFFDGVTPLRIGTQEFVIRSLNRLPERLEPYTHYVPVD